MWQRLNINLDYKVTVSCVLKTGLLYNSIIKSNLVLTGYSLTLTN
jgi:hypothetical protein